MFVCPLIDVILSSLLLCRLFCSVQPVPHHPCICMLERERGKKDGNSTNKIKEIKACSVWHLCDDVTVPAWMFCQISPLSSPCSLAPCYIHLHGAFLAPCRWGCLWTTPRLVLLLIIHASPRCVWPFSLFYWRYYLQKNRHVIFIEVNITARDMTFSTGWQTLSIDCAMGDSVLKVWYLIPGQITGSKRCFSTGRLEHSFNPLTFLFSHFLFLFFPPKFLQESQSLCFSKNYNQNHMNHKLKKYIS
jgi:hypothetical protein